MTADQDRFLDIEKIISAKFGKGKVSKPIVGFFKRFIPAGLVLRDRICLCERLEDLSVLFDKAFEILVSVVVFLDKVPLVDHNDNTLVVAL